MSLDVPFNFINKFGPSADLGIEVRTDTDGTVENEFFSMVNEFFDGTYYNPDNTAQDTYMNSVSYEKYSIK